MAHNKKQFSIIARHPAYGTVTFVIPAADAKAAFNAWKQILAASRQWVVERNDELGTNVVEVTAAFPNPVPVVYDCDSDTGVDDI